MKLSEAVTAYVAYKQSLGMRFATEARTLKSFYRTLGDVEMREVEADRVCAYLAGNGPITTFWYRKLSALRGFYRFALARGYATCSPLPLTVPEEPQAFVPYIYSRDEIKRLLAATAGRERCNLSSLTCRTLLQLATYLGHVHIAATQHYLTMTPELLRHASLRFERYARGGDSHA